MLNKIFGFWLASLGFITSLIGIAFVFTTDGIAHQAFLNPNPSSELRSLVKIIGGYNVFVGIMCLWASVQSVETKRAIAFFSNLMIILATYDIYMGETKLNPNHHPQPLQMLVAFAPALVEKIEHMSDMSEDIGISIPKKFDPVDHVSRNIRKVNPDWKIDKSKDAVMLSGGNLNYTWRVYTQSPAKDESIIVKQAPPFIASKPNIPLDSQRIDFEYKAIQFVNAQTDIVHSTGRPPQVLFYDPKHNALWMEDLGTIPHLIDWIQQAHDKEKAVKVGNNLGRFIAQLHSTTYKRSNMALEFNNKDIQNTRLELMYKQVPQVLSKYVVDTSTKNDTKEIILSKDEHEAVRSAVVALGTKLADITKSSCLTMGDLWPLSVLIDSNDDVRIIDWEFAHYGNPLQDVAHLASHLWMIKDTSESTHQREVAQEVLTSFLDAYRDEMKNRSCVLLTTEEEKRDCSVHFACEIIQRTIGMFNNYLYTSLPPSKTTQATLYAISVILAIIKKHAYMKKVLAIPLLFYVYFLAFIVTNDQISLTEAQLVPKRNYTNCMVVDYGSNLRLLWTVNGSYINLAMQADVNGYVSIGFSTDGTMGNSGKGADAWAASYGIIYDLWMTSEDQPSKDTKQSLTNALYTTYNGTLLVEFIRALDTNDTRDYKIILNDTMPLIWAINPYEKVQAGQDIPGHKSGTVLNAGAVSVNFGRNSSCDVQQGNNSWTSPDGTFRLQWEIVNNDYINFTMQADTKGWLSLGLSTTPRMTNADMYTGWVADATQQVTLIDSWSPDYNQPRDDASLGGTNSILSVSGSQSGTTTEIKFSRKLLTGDSHDTDITNTNLYVLYGWAPTDGSGTTYPKHTTVGAGLVNFMTGASGGSGGGGGGTVVPTNVSDPTGASWSSPNGKFVVNWDMDQTNKAIIIQIRGKTNGWISFGLCEAAKMPNCDFWTGWVDDKTNATTLLDTWSPNYNTPNTDTKNDLTLLGAVQTGGWTIITFQRNWTTGDSGNDIDIKNQYQYVGWALHSSKDGDSTTDLYPQHTDTGMTQINFFTGKSMNIKDRDPGTYLAIVVVATLGCVGAVHTGYKGYKGYLRKKDDDEETTDEVELDNQNSTQVQYDHRKDNQYYVGSQKVVAPASSDLKSVKADSSTPAPIGQKKRSMTACNVIDGLLAARLPKTDISLVMVIVAVIFVGVNMACTQIAMTDRWSLKFGSILAANTFFVAVPATRNSFLVWFLGIPFDRAITFHRWLGRWCLILGILHLSFMLKEWQDLAFDTNKEIATKKSIYGLSALGVLVLMFISTLEPIRRKQFEIFYYVHFIFIGFYVLCWFHVASMRPWIIATAAVYLLDRFLRFAWGIVPQKSLELRLKGGAQDGILQLRFKKNILARLLGMYDAGQYVFVNFPTISFLEWHPFSVSSAPGERTLEVHIKGIGNHTNKLLAAAESKKHLWVRIDGPYGHLRMNYQRFPVVVLICGGIGITPMLSMIREVCKTGERDPKYKQKRSFIENLYFIWAVQSQAQYDWFANELSECYAAEGTRKDVPHLNFMIYITRAPSNGELDPNFIKGRPQFNEIFGAITKEHTGKAVAAFVCGPKLMVNGVWDAINSKRREGHDIHFHKESFEF